MRIVLLGAVALAVATGCPGKSAQPERAQGPAGGRTVDVTDQFYEAPALPRGKVVFPGGRTVEVEIAADDPSRERGLMWRRNLPDGQGMLFIFPTEEEHSFWMRNTLIPLDMIFLAGDGTVVGVVANAVPHSLLSRTVERPSKYVLEVAGGWSARHGVTRGMKLRLQLPAITVGD